jgi:5-methylthioadenosine/S-adenosylhomocysteine deaminase
VLRIRAGQVHPVTAPPIADGAVLVEGARIVAVGPHAVVPSPPDAQALEYPDGVVTPGLVNCHTHLELTHLAGRIAVRDFPAWLRRVRELKDASPPDAVAAGVERALRDCWARGVTCVAETGSTGAALAALAQLGGRGVVYQEVFGPDPAQCETSLAELNAALGRLAPLASDRVRLGVSPHAPYTVSPPLYRAVAAMARLERLPVAVHLAESPAETQLIRDGSGPFADALRARGIAVRPHRVSPARHLLQLGVLEAGPGCLCIHCVQLDERDLEGLRDVGAAVAACPRSNRAHGHGDAPLAALRAAGVRIGLGTDSLLSVPDLDLWAEAGALGLAWDDALTMLTLGGARALGWDQDIGALAVGKAADLAVWPAAGAGARRPATGSRLTVVAGRVVHRA